MKRIILGILILFSWSCDISNSPVDIDPPVEKFELFKIGNIWELDRSGSQLRIKVVEEKNQNWALNFWDDDSLTQLKSKILEIKIFHDKLPEYKYYAVSETDSGWYFGTNFPSIPDLIYEDTIIYKDFFIYKNIKDTTITEDYIKDYGSFKFTYQNKTQYSLENIEVADSIYHCVKIKHSREQTEFGENIKSGEEYYYSNDIGFIYFWDYKLLNFKSVE